MSTDAQKEAYKRYREKRIQLAVSYSLQDIEEGQRIKEYLKVTNKSANSYIKQLIREDLDRIGFTIHSGENNDK